MGRFRTEGSLTLDRRNDWCLRKQDGIQLLRNLITTTNGLRVS